MMRLLTVVLLGALAASAQYRRGSQGPRGNAPTITGEIAAEFAGVLKKVDGSKIYLELSDGNTMEFRATRKTKITLAGKEAKLKDLVEGGLALIEGKHAPGAIEAVTIVMKSKEKQP
jgi:hypothetical protein